MEEFIENFNLFKKFLNSELEKYKSNKIEYRIIEEIKNKFIELGLEESF